MMLRVWSDRDAPSYVARRTHRWCFGFATRRVFRGLNAVKGRGVDNVWACSITSRGVFENFF
jgi:hypothetical protein